ncbi:MAG: flagellar biosynthesis protein FlhA [Halanaerobiales bacterium]|nr:flagellar biosynthesis protein FlhA [Halanaerobiales bacterium]
MPSVSGSSTLNKIFNNIDVLFAFAVVGIVIMFIIPMPTILMDLLLTANITFSMLIILVSIYINEPLQVSVFPSLLLFATLFRLGLNVSTTRLILGQGYAGEIITSFGNFVVGGNYVVGFIIFLILVIIQYVVITKGAERVAEVAARFTLDAMPGKQMSIDADLNAGIIDEFEAQEQRKKIRQEADFYGAMDGASKFVKGDAIAGIIITVINIIGGLIIGMAQQGLSFGEAAQTYTLLTVGDGLVSQIPALLISTATGMIVTRAASEKNMGQEVSSQLMSQPKAMYIASVVLFILGLMPGLPTVPFIVMALLIGGLGLTLRRTVKESTEEIEEKQEPTRQEVQQAKEAEIKNIIKVDQLEVEVGYNLISFVLPDQGGDFLDRVSMIRKQMAIELGIIIPPVRILDNLQLEPNIYRIKLKGVEISRYKILPDHFLAMDSGMTTEDIDGIDTKEPAFGTPAIWIDESKKEKAELANYTIVDPPSVMATHLTEVIKEHAHELLGRQEVKELIDNIKDENSAVVDELLPDLLSLGEIQKVLQNLLWENIPINNLVTILETLADFATSTKNIDLLTEYVRQGLSRQITNQYTNDDNELYTITLDPQLEESLGQNVEQSDQGNYLAVEPQQAQQLIENISQEAQKLLQQGKDPILVTSPMIRRPLKELTSRSFSQLIVLSFSELSPDVNLQVLGTVSN